LADVACVDGEKTSFFHNPKGFPGPFTALPHQRFAGVPEIFSEKIGVPSVLPTKYNLL
jgi:hypothetical protein